jgi:luciferase-type oxidoreductase
MLTLNTERSGTENLGYRRMFAPGQLTLGVFFPIEAFSGDRPTMAAQERLAGLAEEAGFAALWFRDVPLRDPDFGDVGQIFDPWVYLGYIAAQTTRIALATGAVILPLRHPLHTAKAAASIDQLSRGRLVLGVSSGDRPLEFPAFATPFESRGELFREALQVMRAALSSERPFINTQTTMLDGRADLVPKPVSASIPVLITGHSRQELDWIARHGDGWLMYPRPPELQQLVIRQWHDKLAEAGRSRSFAPFAQSLYIDLDVDRDAVPVPIHLGYRLGRNYLLALLEQLRAVGVNHVALNLKYGSRPAAAVMEELATYVLPHFPPPVLRA